MIKLNQISGLANLEIVFLLNLSIEIVYIFFSFLEFLSINYFKLLNIF